MKILVSTILMIILTTSSFAQSTIVKQGDPAPYDGVLLTPERAEKAVKAEKKVIVLSDLRLTQDQLIDHYKDVADQERKQRLKNEFDNGLKNMGYFILGTLLTAFAFKTVETVRDI